MVAEDGLSHVIGQLSDADSKEVENFPYRSVLESLRYKQVHTGVNAAYPDNVLSRFTNDYGPRHIKYLKQLILFLIGTVDDRLIFRKIPMTAACSFAMSQMQAFYHVDANLAGQTCRYSQESLYLSLVVISSILVCISSQLYRLGLMNRRSRL